MPLLFPRDQNDEFVGGADAATRRLSLICFSGCRCTMDARRRSIAWASGPAIRFSRWASAPA